MRAGQVGVSFDAHTFLSGGWQVCALAGMLLCIAATAADAAWGQCEPVWTQRMDVPAARVQPAMAYDSQREVVVLFGGDNRHVEGDDVLFRQLWEWDGAVWTRRSDVSGGPQVDLDDIAMTYDSWRGVLVVRHKPPGGVPAATWEFDGQDWSLRSTDGPQLRVFESLTFDSRRGVTVLWSESGIGTWEWDGTAWTFRDPGPMDGFVELAFDAARGVTVAFGVNNNQAETWEWDGVSWTLAAVGGPPRRVNHSLAYDPLRRAVLVFGGQLNVLRYDDTWSWDGTSWSFISAGEPSERGNHAMAFDAARGEMVVFGGEPEHDVFLSDTWTFDGDTWTLADLGDPRARSSHNMAYDSRRGVAVLFGGHLSGSSFRVAGDTWEHDASRWRLVRNDGPPPRNGHGMTFDSRRGITVLFGGSDASGCLGDTWEWNGRDWTLRSTQGPTPRTLVQLAYDPVRERTVLFGGHEDRFPRLGDTWEWDGDGWARVAVDGPSPRSQYGMVYDDARGRIVLFGGVEVPAPGEFIYHNDTWSWDGSRWAQLSAGGPPPRLEHSMAYDSKRGLILVFGGRIRNSEYSDTWLWDGNDWSEFLGRGPLERTFAPMVYAADRDALVLHGGRDGSGKLADLWEFRSPDPPIGDLNCDCSVNAFDIEPFILALFDPEGYQAAYPDCDLMLADLNGDGNVNAFDIEPFIERLFNP